MNENSTELSWADANQAFLVAEFARLKERLGSKPEEHSEPASTPPVRHECPAAIDWLAAAFGLSPFEREVLLLCAGVEMDSRLATLCGEAQGHPQRCLATFGLALAVLPEPHWSALTPARPLRRFRLVELASGQGLTASPLRIDERILHFLAGINTLDSRLEGFVQPSVALEEMAPAHKAMATQLCKSFEACGVEPPLVTFCGDDWQGQEDVANLVTRQTGRQLFIAQADGLPAQGPELEQFNLLWQRESLLLRSALLIQCRADLPSTGVQHLVERLPGLVFFASREPIPLERPSLRFDVNKPVAREQRVLWERALGPEAVKANGMLNDLSAQFRLSARTIIASGRLLGGAGGTAQPRELWEVCRSLSRPRLADLAQRIIPSAEWDDLVLPQPQTQTLRQIASQVLHRMTVYETWGFSAKGQRGLGVSALFAGESGTGKTLAAEVLARELELDLYRIDLSGVVSKYIGETEKNLQQVFDAAEEGGVILLFDEADALFGKRSDIKDSHDRYANIEVSYLLQRMEAYHGLAILTTNLKSALDRAFQRRIRFFVNFPFPDAAQRQAIWTRIFPARTPTLGLDHKRLSQLNMPGGNIRNIALNAAFLAADDGIDVPVEMKHVLHAARIEAEKIERPLSDAETRGWI